MTTWPTACDVPGATLLSACRASGVYVDCYALVVEPAALLADYIEAFYSSPVFKLERTLLGVFAGKGANDDDARALARGDVTRFAIWTVEERREHELLLRVGRTRSWLALKPTLAAGESRTTLYFGSAVFRAAGSEGGAGLDLPFRALLGFHKLYSRALIFAAASKLTAA